MSTNLPSGPSIGSWMTGDSGGSMRVAATCEMRVTIPSTSVPMTRSSSLIPTISTPPYTASAARSRASSMLFCLLGGGSVSFSSHQRFSPRRPPSAALANSPQVDNDVSGRSGPR